MGKPIKRRGPFKRRQPRECVVCDAIFDPASEKSKSCSLYCMNLLTSQVGDIEKARILYQSLLIRDIAFSKFTRTKVDES